MGEMVCGFGGAVGAKYGVRWQSEAATPLSACREVLNKAVRVMGSESAVDAALCRRTPKLRARAPALLFGHVLTLG
jgi:hypothetical protein